jgi:hypothetical protein
VIPLFNFIRSAGAPGNQSLLMSKSMDEDQNVSNGGASGQVPHGHRASVGSGTGGSGVGPTKAKLKGMGYRQNAALNLLNSDSSSTESLSSSRSSKDPSNSPKPS